MFLLVEIKNRCNRTKLCCAGRFLSKVLTALGVDISYGWEVLALCDDVGALPVTNDRPFVVAHKVTRKHTSKVKVACYFLCC